MKLETFFEKFEHLADVPNAVEKMRELILELAVHGRLVRQHSLDEPASIQLARIADKKSLSDRPERRRITTDRPSLQGSAVTLPLGWARCSVAELMTVLNGRAYAKEELLTTGTPVLRVGNLFTSKHWYYSDLELEPNKYCEQGDLIFAWSASFGPFIWAGPRVIYHYHIWKLVPHCDIDLDKRYLYWFLQNKTQEIKRAGHGVSMLHMTKEKMERLEVLVPPLAEQKRIVAKVDELMALCDRLAAQQQERQKRHAALARASLARFADAPTPASLAFLFHGAYTIDPADLRNTILALAVQGKLVPQDPTDEIGDAIIARIARANVPLGLDGKNEPAALRPVKEQETPFLVPPSWSWTRLGTIAGIKHGFAFQSESFTSDQTAFVVTTPGNFYEKGGFRDRGPKTKYYRGNVPSEFVLRPRDLIIPMTEQAPGLLGSPAFIPDDGRTYLHNQRLGKLAFYSDSIAPEFAYWFFNTAFFRDELAKTCTGMKVRHTSPRRILTVPFPVLALAEQRRIVAKVEELMALVDELEEKLAAAKTMSVALLEAAIHELLNPTAEIIPFPSAERGTLPDRAAIGCYAIQQLGDKRTFGRTAEVKVLYLAQAHLGLDLGGRYLRDAAGPLDQWIYKFEEEAARRQWFSVVESLTKEGHKKIDYRPGTNLSAKAQEGATGLSATQRREFDRLLGLLAQKPTVEVEIIATLFAAWNDFLIDGRAPSDDEIVREVRENWHLSKQRFTQTELKTWLAWLRQHALVPQGKGPRTVGQQGKLQLH